MSRTAVVLFNLGGPDSIEAVRPFLFNLFNDPAIIRLPQPLRWCIARLISARRATVAQEIYRHLGGGSPILANTEAQARALDQSLGVGFRTFIAMRYWRPASDAAATAAKAWNPDSIVLVPLYPQFSTTTTASSVADWHEAAARARLAVPTRLLCCWPEDPGFIAAVAEPLAQALTETPAGERTRVLFSAHGLPEKIVASGDPYPWQVERTVAAVLKRLARPELDAVLCFQSRVGPLAWIKPATDAEIRRAGAERISLIVVPIAFVSEHSETLVELDRDYGKLAAEVGVPRYRRLPTVDAHPAFIGGLAERIKALAEAGPAIASAGGGRLCPPGFAGCPQIAGVRP
jgi:protoporphyrin/coproporphyrin ferrochelatase